MRIKLSTVITVNDDISNEALENIRHEFEDVAWENNMIPTQPSVTIEEVK